MSPSSHPPSERRLDRRIPLNCTASIMTISGHRHDAVCVELGVGGMTLHSLYVPAASEVIEVSVASPGGAGSDRHPPLRARVEVLRCHGLGNGQYEIGGKIVAVLG